MRNFLRFLFMVAMLMMVWSTFAQTNAPAFDPNLAPLPATKEQYWMYAIAVITPVIVWMFGKIPQLPRPILPLLAPVVGIILGYILQHVSSLNLDWWDGGKAGMVAVFIRESINQLVTKQMKPLEDSKTSTKPVDGAVAVKETP